MPGVFLHMERLLDDGKFFFFFTRDWQTQKMIDLACHVIMVRLQLEQIQINHDLKGPIIMISK